MENSVLKIIYAVFLGLSLVFEKRSLVLANGIMLGGLFALVYGAARGLGSQDSMVTFITVGVGLAAVVLIGMRRFSRPRDVSNAPPD